MFGISGSPTVNPGTSSNSKRGIFNVTVSGAGPFTNTAGATTFVQACQSLPGSTASINSDHLGNSAFVGNPWYLGLGSYNHVGAPNSMNCQNVSGDASYITYVGPTGSAPATSNHSGGVNLGMADGSVRFVRDSVNLTVWWAVGTRLGKEIVPSDAF